MIRAVTFDAAGTLMAPREPVGRTYARIAREHGIAADEDDVERRFRAAFRAAPPLAFGDVDAAARAARERGWWRDVVRAALGTEAASPRFERCFDALYAHFAGGDAWHVYPDVRPALAALRRRGLRTAVVSNFDARLPSLLDHLGLAATFDAIVWSTDVGVAKPSPEIFRHAVRRLDVAPAETLHAGDDPAADVEAAQRAGLRAILVDRSGEAPDALATLAHLEQLLDATPKAQPT